MNPRAALGAEAAARGPGPEAAESRPERMES